MIGIRHKIVCCFLRPLSVQCNIRRVRAGMRVSSGGPGFREWYVYWF